jgi:RNA polymerase sigma-70 factor (ECF subfamily)
MLGYPVAITAEILGVSEGTVKSRCARGRARLLPRLAHLRRPTEQRSAGTRARAPGNRSATGDVLPAREGGENPS